MPKALRGRPTLLNPKLKEDLLILIREGNYLQTACEAVGVKYSTVRSWVRRGKNVDSQGRKPTPEYTQFAKDIEQAFAEAEVTLLKQIKSHGPDDWRATSWLIARRYPERWGEHHRLNKLAEAKAAQTIDRILSIVSDDAKREIISAIHGQSDDGAGEQAQLAADEFIEDVFDEDEFED